MKSKNCQKVVLKALEHILYGSNFIASDVSCILSDCHNSDEVNYMLNAFRFKKKSQNMFSYVTAAHAQIHGEAAVYVKVGSTISLTCTINLYSVPPPDITWYHGSKVCT